MPYLNMDLDYFEHRKTKRLIGLLGRGAEVLPIRLWSYCGKFHCENGRLTGYSEQEIESLATWWGKPGIMLPAMKTSEYMDRDAVGWFMHEWLEHQGHLVAFKAKGRAMANTRWEKARAEAARLAASNAASMLQAMPTKEVGSVGTDQSGKGDARGKGVDGEVFPQLKRELGAYWKRVEGKPWDYEDERLLFDICRSPTAVHEWNTIISFRSKVKQFQCQSMTSLLQNWNRELDKARNYEPPQPMDRAGNPIKNQVSLMPKLSRVEREEGL